MALIEMNFAEGGVGSGLELVDSKWNGTQTCSLSHTCTKSGYYYIYVCASGYSSGSYGGDCTITVNGTAISSSDYLFSQSQVNINSAYLAKIQCNKNDVIAVTVTGRGTGYYGNAILILT